MAGLISRQLRFVLLSLGLTTVATALPVDFDTSFGNNGIATVDGSSYVRDMALLPDGGLLIVDYSQSRVLRLDASGRVDASFTPIAPLFVFAGIRSIAVLPDGRIHVLHSGGDIICRVYITRHSASGVQDMSYGTDGRWEASGGRCAVMSNLAVTPNGESYFSWASASLPTVFRSVYRVDATGRTSMQIGRVEGREIPPHSYGRIAMQTDGRPVIAVAASHLAAARLLGTSFDSSFAGVGIATSTVTPAGSITHDVALSPDGRVVVAGPVQAGNPRSLAFTRFTDSGIVDETFGDGGVAIVEVAKAGEHVLGVLLAAQPDGKIVFAGYVGKVWPAPLVPRMVIGRLNVQGRLDDTFAPTGMADILLERGTSAAALAVRPDRSILVAGSVSLSAPLEPLVSQGVVMRLIGGDGPPASAVQQRKAIEFYHPGYGHYFLTADVEEVAMLDGWPASGWSRTGAAFDVWHGADVTLTRMCRFWSDQTWAPKSSHFYTPYETECDTVRQSTAWQFERDAFSVKLPDGAPGARTCPVGSRPLYRAYNNGLTGAPNHRYMVDASILDAMIAQGWTMEGEAATRVFACVPAP